MATADGTVQSIARAFDVLEYLADAGGELSLSELAVVSGLPQPTIHRLLRTLVAQGYVRQEPSRRYALGPKLIRLGDRASRLVERWARPYLTGLVQATGETANLAVLDGDEAVYTAQVPSRHSMRVFAEVGKRVPAHCTAVGKVMLAQLPDSEVLAIMARSGMPARTPHTITDPQAFVSHLAEVRAQGWAIDDGEQEIGVRCLAVLLPDAPAPSAISVSGPTDRMTDAVREQCIPLLTSAAKDLAQTLDLGGG